MKKTKARLYEVDMHSAAAQRHEAQLTHLRHAHKALTAFLKITQGELPGHAGSARRLIEVEAVMANNDLEFHLAKLREAGAAMPEGLDHSDDVVACWGCRRGPLTSASPQEANACPLGAECRAER